MASELYVETLKGLTSGANANKVIVPAGQTLDASAGGFIGATGQVLQTVDDSTTSEFSINTDSMVNTLTVSITAKAANSRFLCFAVPVRLIVYSGNEVRIQFFDGTNNSPSTRMNSGGGIDLYYPPYIHGIIQGTHSAGATLTIAMRAKRQSGANSNIIGDNGSISTIVVQEIAG